MTKKSLLIADDDGMNRTIIKRFLKNDFEILEAADGRQTLEYIKNEHVDVVLLDIIMPELDGLEVLKEVRSNSDYDYLGILVATSTKEKTERTALSLGADDIVSKPYDPIVIKKRVENILLMKEAKRQNRMFIENAVDDIVKENSLKAQEAVAASVSKMQKIIQVISENANNEKLVAEMAQSMNLETAALMDFFTRS